MIGLTIVCICKCDCENSKLYPSRQEAVCICTLISHFTPLPLAPHLISLKYINDRNTNSTHTRGFICWIVNDSFFGAGDLHGRLDDLLLIFYKVKFFFSLFTPFFLCFFPQCVYVGCPSSWLFYPRCSEVGQLHWLDFKMSLKSTKASVANQLKLQCKTKLNKTHTQTT